MAKCLDLLTNYVKERKATPEEYVLDIGYGAEYEEGVQFREQVVSALKSVGFNISVEDIPIFRVGSAIAVHTGPYALGVTILKRAI